LIQHPRSHPIRSARAFVLCVLAAVLVGVPLVAPITPARANSHLGSWATIADMQRARFSTGATTGPCPAPPPETFDRNRRCVYAIGGNYTLTDVNLMAEYYDPADRGWHGLPPMTAAAGLQQVAAATGSDGRIYAFGYAYPFNSVTVEAYNPALNIWEPVPPPVYSARPGAAAVADAEGRIYLLGGKLGDGYLDATDKVEVYDPSEGEAATWKSVPAMTKPRSNFAAALGSDKRLYAVGGAGVRGSAERFNPGRSSLPSWSRPRGRRRRSGAKGRRWLPAPTGASTPSGARSTTSVTPCRPSGTR